MKSKLSSLAASQEHGNEPRPSYMHLPREKSVKPPRALARTSIPGLLRGEKNVVMKNTPPE